MPPSISSSKTYNDDCCMPTRELASTKYCADEAWSTNGRTTCFTAHESAPPILAKSPIHPSTPTISQSWTPPSHPVAMVTLSEVTHPITRSHGMLEPLKTFASFALSRGISPSTAPSRIGNALELLVDAALLAHAISVTPTKTASWTAHSADRLTQYLHRGESLPLSLIAQVMNSLGR